MIKPGTLAESHRRQFAGEDYQQVAQDLCDQMENPTDGDNDTLSTSPDPACECGFCGTVKWGGQ